MRKLTLFASLVATVTLATVSGWAQGAASPRARSLPTFEVDRSWPKPRQVEARRRLQLRHRRAGQRLAAAPSAHAASPKTPNGGAAGDGVRRRRQFVKAWGGAGNGYEWPEREHGIHIDTRASSGSGGNNCPTNGAARR